MKNKVLYKLFNSLYRISFNTSGISKSTKICWDLKMRYIVLSETDKLFKKFNIK